MYLDGYSSLALVYESLETLSFGRALQRARCALLNSWEGEPPESVLVLGDGDGRFLEKAVKAWPNTDFLCIDQSEGMIAFSKKRLFPEARVQFIHADVRDGLTALDQSTFDVIVSHFFLDCFKDETLHDLIPEIAARLKPQGHWYVSEFTADTWWQRVLLWGMYRFFHLVTKTEASTFPAYTEIMQAHGFTVKRLGTWKADFVVADHFQRSSP